MRYSIIISVLILFSLGAKGQFRASEINDTLKIGANSLVQAQKTEIQISSMTSGKGKFMQAITILNESGKRHGDFSCYCDNFNLLKQFNGQIINAQGEIMKKISKSDLKMTAYSQALADDGYTFYYECHFPSYPFTIIYEWEEEYKNGILGFPSLYPVSYYDQAVKYASYSICVPEAMGCRYKERNVAGIVETTKTGGNIILKAEIKNIPAFEYKSFMPKVSDLVPAVFFGPDNFIYDEKAGCLSTWNSFGQWLYRLQVGRDILPIPFKQKLHELTDTCSTPREKVKAVYNYIADNTRYVSIQLGIGGLQTMTAEDVCKYGFGDCKGLSNFVQSMLKELNIKSNYTVISTTNKNLMRDFSSAGQMDHVILQVPLPNDTIWLECTNPDYPFGYIHQQIAGHDALVIDETGGKICKLPAYADSLNKHSATCNITLKADCSAMMNVEENYYLENYEEMEGFYQLTNDKRADYLRKKTGLNNPEISDIKVTKNKSEIPYQNWMYKVYTNLYGKRTGNRMFIPANIFRSFNSSYNDAKRKYPISLNASLRCDTINITIPDGYVVESMPKSYSLHYSEKKLIKAEFKYSQSGNVIQIIQNVFTSQSDIPASENAIFRIFYNKIIKGYNDKIILRKE